MKILALEFSSAQRSVAVVQAEANSRSSFVTTEIVETGSRSTKAFGMIEEALLQAHVEREQVDCLAIGLGPGSYTGIRAAIALAQGWQLARDVKLLGVSSVEAIAAQASADGLAGSVAIVIDAQRQEFYLSVFEVGHEKQREVESLRLVTHEKVDQCQNAGQVLIGPEVTKWFPSGRIVFPRASTLGQLAVRRTDFVAGERLEPIYLRETAFVKAVHPRRDI